VDLKEKGNWIADGEMDWEAGVFLVRRDNDEKNVDEKHEHQQ
jgi:hypothetical protein